MTTALAIAQRTIAEKSTSSYYRGGMSYCQQFVGEYWEIFFGRGTPNSYASAQAACNASSIFSTNWRDAVPGDIIYFRYSSYGHVGIYLGSGLMVSATGWSTNAVASLGKSVYIHRVDDYAAHLTLIGFSHTNGARAQITGLTDASAPAVLANQRVAKTGGARLRHMFPTTLAQYIAAENIAQGAIVTPNGWVQSAYEGGVANGSDRWFVFGDVNDVANVKFAHTSGFTKPDVENVPFLGVLAPPKPIEKFAVSIRYLNDTDDEKVVVIEAGQLLPEPTAPERDEFDFQGWGVGGVLYDFSKPVTTPFTLEALWSAKPEPEVPVDPEEPGEPVDPPTEGPGDDNTVTPTKGIPWGVIIGGIVTAIFAVIAAALGFGGQ